MIIPSWLNKTNGIEYESNLIPKSSINNFFKSFKNIVEYFIDIDLSLSNSFDDPILNEYLIKCRKLKPHLFSAIYDTFLKSVALEEFVYKNKLHKLAGRFLNIASNKLYVHGLMLRMDVPNDKRNLYGWHQDSVYDRINSSPSNGAVIWTPLVNTDKNNGALIFCPGSNNEPNHIVDSTDEVKYGRSRQLITPAEVVSKYESRSVPVKAGDALCMNANLIHKSGENISSKIRFTVLARFNIITTSDFYLKENIK